MTDNPCDKVFAKWYVTMEKLWRLKTTDELLKMKKRRCFSRREKEIYDGILKDRRVKFPSQK